MNETKSGNVNDAAGCRRLAWAGPRATLWLILGVLALRLVYLGAINPYELAGDEAHYWEWSRRPALSYYSKGPGVAWTILGSTALLGDTEFAIRFPAALCGALAMAGAALLGVSITRDRRTGFFCAAALALVPAFAAYFQFMTIDAPLIACWTWTICLAWLIFDRWEQGKTALGLCAAMGVVLGIGFLFKYTMALLLPGLLVYLLLMRKRLHWGRGVVGLLAMLLVFCVTISPVLIWNHQHGWPTVAHLLGHLGVSGGDVQIKTGEAHPYNPMWTLLLIAGQLLAVGPILLALMAMGLRKAGRERREQPRHWRGAQLMFWCALPTLAFYLAVSFFDRPEANWPTPAWVSLAILVGIYVGPELQRYYAKIAAWCALPEPRPKEGFFRRKPETLWQVFWHWSVGWGIVMALGIAFGIYARDLPLLRESSGWNRITGHRAQAMRVHHFADSIAEHTGQRPPVFVDHYGKTSLMAFYLPDQPVVYSAASSVGQRKSAYDMFEDTDIAAPDLMGRAVICVGGHPSKWTKNLRFDRLQTLDEERQIYLGHGYAGIQSKEQGDD